MSEYGRKIGRAHWPAGCGFTLLELLVVVTIIALLATLVLPSLSQALQKAKAVTCVNNLKQISYAITIYTDDYAGYYPFTDTDIPNNGPTSTFASKLIPHLAGNWQSFWSSYRDRRDLGTFICPSWRAGEGSPPVYETPRMPNRDYAANYFLCTRSSVWNVQPVKSDYRIEETQNAWVNWLVADASYRRILNDINGPVFYGTYAKPTYWQSLGFQPRHSNGANALFRDNSVRRIPGL